MNTIAATAAMEVSALGFGAMVAASMMDMTGLAASGALAIGGELHVLKYACTYAVQEMRPLLCT